MLNNTNIDGSVLELFDLSESYSNASTGTWDDYAAKYSDRGKDGADSSRGRGRGSDGNGDNDF